jgi:SEC-C motif-containing protein
MRARYSAYAVKKIKFLKTSAGPEVQAEFDEEACTKWAEASSWNGLEIVGTDRGGENDDEGYVEFIAHYAANGNAVEHHEHSYFKKLNGEWKFIDGEIESGVPYVREEPKIGRNDPCPCGSGKKYKKCCGKHAEG